MHHRRSALRRVVPLLLLASLILTMGLSAQLAQQPPPRPAATPQPASNPNDLASEGTAALSGVVRDATTHEPIPGVMVYLGFQGRGAVGRLSRQITDDKGRFVFTDLAAGSLYFINASKFGYLDGHFGVGAGGLLGGLITLTDGQWLSTANIVMQRLGSIGGTVLDEHGDPAVGVFVRVLSQGLIGGQRRLVPGQTAKTDDRGAYRLVDLLPGRYMLHVPFIQQTYSSTLTPADLAGLTAEQIAAGRSAPDPPLAIEADSNARLAVGFIPPPSPVNGRAQTYLSLFYPGVASIGDATTVDLHPGENRQAVNFSLRAVPATAISGVVDGPAQSLQGLVVRLLPEGLEDAGGTFETATATTGSDGRFTFLNVPAASYTIEIRRSVTDVYIRPALSTSSVQLPLTPGIASAGGGSILGGPDGASYANRNSRASGSYFARQKVTAGVNPVTDLVVVLKQASTIRGRFVMNTGESLVGTPGLNSIVFAEPADGASFHLVSSLTAPAPQSAPSLTFEIPGLAGGSYRLRFLSAPWNGAIMSVMGDDGIDYRVKPFDTSMGRDFNVTVTITGRRIDLSGSAADEKGTQVPNAIVIAFPVERDQWTNYGTAPARLKGSPTNSAGVYRFQSLPAGDYYLLGVPPDQADIWQDPAKLALMAALATRVSLAWGDTKVQPVTVVRIR